MAGVSAHYFWAAPLEAVVVLGLGINELGLSFLFGFILLLAIIPVQSHFGKRFGERSISGKRELGPDRASRGQRPWDGLYRK